MKKLFLASFAAVSMELIAELLPRPAHTLKAAFIPTAAQPYKNKDFVMVDREALVNMGMNVIDVELSTTRGTELEEVLSDVDVILVAGGNTFYLLEQIHKSGFDEILKKRLAAGVVYIGSSAGSVVCGPSIDAVKVFDDPADSPDLTDFTGLGYVDTVILPHVQKEKYWKRLDVITAELDALAVKFAKLTDDEAIVVNGEVVKKVALKRE